jgi:hypothetical protein
MTSFALAVALLAASYSVAPAASLNLMIGTDMGHTDLYFFNMDKKCPLK